MLLKLMFHSTDFEELSGKIHQIVKLEPSSNITMTGFYQAGGINALLKVLLRDLPLFNDSIGVTLQKTSELVKRRLCRQLSNP